MAARSPELYLGENDLHPGRWFGLLEDVFVDEGERGRASASP
jgi:hypothetical protein